MNDDHIIRFNLANADELSSIKATALRINQILKEYFDSIGIILVDFKLEFGRYNDQILLADEISPDTCRFWEKGTNRAEFFRGEVNKYGWVDTGSSFLPSEVSAAFLWAQIEDIDRIQERRKEIWQWYDTNVDLLSLIHISEPPRPS